MEHRYHQDSCVRKAMRYLKPSFWVFMLDFRAVHLLLHQVLFLKMHPTLQPCKETAWEIYQNLLPKNCFVGSLLKMRFSRLTISKTPIPPEDFVHVGMLESAEEWRRAFENHDEMGWLWTLDTFPKRRRTWTWKIISIGVMFHNFPSCFLALKAVVFSQKSTQFHRSTCCDQLVAINLVRSKAKASSSSIINNVALNFWGDPSNSQNLVEHGTSSNTRHRKFMNVLKKKRQTSSKGHGIWTNHSFSGDMPGFQGPCMWQHALTQSSQNGCIFFSGGDSQIRTPLDTSC